MKPGNANPPSKDGVNSLHVPRLRVAGLRGEDLKNSIPKLPLKLFYLATRNTHHATSHTTMSKNQVVNLGKPLEFKFDLLYI